LTRRSRSRIAALAADQHVQRRGDLLLDQAAHRQHLAAHVLDLAVELAGNVLRKMQSIHARSLRRPCVRKTKDRVRTQP
jgi:hypothetical protein